MQTCARRGISFWVICLNGGDGSEEIRLRGFNWAPSLHGRLTVDNGPTWRFLRSPGSFHILLFFISPEVAKSTHKFTPTFVNLPILHWNEPSNTESHRDLVPGQRLGRFPYQYLILHHHMHGHSVTLISALNRSPQRCGQPSSAQRPDPDLESVSASDLTYRSLTVHPTFMHARISISQQGVM